MTRLLRPLLIFVFLALGAGIGALNATPVQVDLGALRFEAALGLVLLGSLLTGVLLGGLALTVSVVLPMRRRWRRECDALRAAQASAQVDAQGDLVSTAAGMAAPTGKPDGIPY